MCIHDHSGSGAGLFVQVVKGHIPVEVYTCSGCQVAVYRMLSRCCCLHANSHTYVRTSLKTLTAFGVLSCSVMSTTLFLLQNQREKSLFDL